MVVFFPDMEIWGYPRDPNPQTLANFLASIWACGGYARMGISQMGKWETNPWSVPRSGSILSTKKTQQWAEKPWLILVDEWFIGVIPCCTMLYSLIYSGSYSTRGSSLTFSSNFQGFRSRLRLLGNGLSQKPPGCQVFYGSNFSAMAAMEVPHLQVSAVLHLKNRGICKHKDVSLNLCVFFWSHHGFIQYFQQITLNDHSREMQISMSMA